MTTEAPKIDLRLEPTRGEWILGLVVVLVLVGFGFFIGRKSVLRNVTIPKPPTGA